MCESMPYLFEIPENSIHIPYSIIEQWLDLLVCITKLIRQQAPHTTFAYTGATFQLIT